jgi:glycosyltransferase involved in cell wall biosynthesis
MKNGSQPYFSIVIPTLNEEKALPRLLKDLVRQSFFLEHLEVIHVDGHSDDRTLAAAALFTKKLRLTSLTCDKRNVSEQRNLGARQATGKWIIFMDADNRLPHTFLDGLKYQLIKHPRTDVFSVPPAPLNQAQSSTRDRLVYELNTLQMEVTKSIGQPVTLGAMLGIRREVFIDVQFRPEFKIAEDCEFTREAIKKGYEYVLFDEPTYEYSLRRLDRDGFLKQARVQVALLLRFFDKNAKTKSDFGYDMSGGATYASDNKPATTQNEQWQASWRRTFASLQRSSAENDRNTASWLHKLHDYAQQLGLAKN